MFLLYTPRSVELLVKMPKNMGKGGKSFKAGNSKGNMQNQKRELIYADTEAGEEYAQMRRALGNLRVELQLAGGRTVVGVIRGAMVRKVYISVGDVVLISKREFNVNDVVDVIYRYSNPEVRALVKDNVIPRDFRSVEERNTSATHDYEFVAEKEDDEDDEKENMINRDEVIDNDPLAALDDL